MPIQFKNSEVVDWGLRLVLAGILGMAAPAKFTADPGAVAIFTQLDAEPFGRLATGVFEAMAVILLLVPATTVFGALLAAGLMSGALLAHLTVLGVAPGGDASMFSSAVAAFLVAVALVWRRRRQIPVVGRSAEAGEASVR